MHTFFRIHEHELFVYVQSVCASACFRGSRFLHSTFHILMKMCKRNSAKMLATIQKSRSFFRARCMSNIEHGQTCINMQHCDGVGIDH